MTFRFAPERANFVYSAIAIVVILALGAYGLFQPTRGNISIDAHSNTANSTTATVRTIVEKTFMNSTLASAKYAFAPYGLDYLSFEPGCQLGNSESGPWYPAPCAGTLSTAVVFDCATAARSQSGCTQRVYLNGTLGESYVMTVWYNPALGNSKFGYNSGLSWINCEFSVPSPAGSSLSYAYYIALNSTSFLVGRPIPTPP